VLVISTTFNRTCFYAISLHCMLARHFGPRAGQMIAGTYRSAGGVTGDSNCSIHSDRKIQERKVGREEEMKAGKYKLSDTDRNTKFHICSSFPRHYFSSISVPLPTEDAGTHQFSLIHHYITILQSSKLFIFYNFLILAHLPFLCPQGCVPFILFPEQNTLSVPLHTMF
jgi:hypothetical protein